MTNEPRPCWLCDANPQQPDSPYCPTCQAEIEADSVTSAARMKVLRALVEWQGGDVDIIDAAPADPDHADA